MVVVSLLLCLSIAPPTSTTLFLPSCDAKSVGDTNENLVEENPMYKRNKKKKKKKKKQNETKSSLSMTTISNSKSKSQSSKKIKPKKKRAATSKVPVDTQKDDSDDTSDDDYDEESDDEEDHDDGLSVKSRVSNALSANKSFKKTILIMNKYRAQVTVALVLIAFRSEIVSVLFRVMTEPAGADGKRKMKRLSPTAILKIGLFLDFMMKILSITNGDNNGASTTTDSNSVRRWIEEALSAVAMKSRYKNPTYVPPLEQHYTFERINERYVQDQLAFHKAFQSASFSGDPKPTGRRLLFETPTQFPKIPRNLTTSTTTYNSTCIILELKKLDTGVSQMESLRDKVSFLLNQHRANIQLKKYQQLSMDANITGNNTTNSTNISKYRFHAETEIVVLLESPGGSASDYGLAAEQLGRLTKEPGINVTVCVDKVAASGGYMMAVMATPGRLFAAPLSIVGSIGVIGQTVNIHNALQNYGVKPLVFRGGKDKAPVGMIGEVTKDGIMKVQEMVDKTHAAFKRHIVQARPQLLSTIDTLATGDVWLGTDALHVGLVDKIISSDEYLDQRMQQGARVLKLKIHTKPRFALFGGGRPGSGLPTVMSKIHEKVQNLNSAAKDIFTLIQKFKSFAEETNINLAPFESEGYDSTSTSILAKALEVNSVQAKKI